MTFALSLSADTVLTHRPSARVTCPLTRALLGRCDGHATLSEVTRQLRLPLALGRALARRALTRQWAAAALRPEWQSHLNAVSRLNVPALLREASTLIHPSVIQTGEAYQRDLRLAVQLLLRAQQRQLSSVLDELGESDWAT